MLQNIKEQLSALKLHGMAEGLDRQMRTPMAADMDFAERLLLLVQEEKSARETASSLLPCCGRPGCAIHRPASKSCT